jgi:hypothetical protein
MVVASVCLKRAGSGGESAPNAKEVAARGGLLELTGKAAGNSKVVEVPRSSAQRTSSSRSFSRSDGSGKDSASGATMRNKSLKEQIHQKKRTYKRLKL